jgi:PPOX class probable F420-dependent enzyme
MRSMAWPEASRFLLAGTRTAKVATVNAQGRPHVAPVWFTVDGRDLVFSTSSRSVKARNLNHDPRVAVTVDDETPPFAFVSITGHARLITRPDDFLCWTTRIAARYVGAQRGPELGKLYTEMDDLLVRVHIDSLTARADVIG